jgi:Fic family protein
MQWNWQHPDWPKFRYRPDRLALREAEYLRHSGVAIGAARHLPDDERLTVVLELIGTEALKTSEIEGETLDRESVQSSLRKQFGLQTDGRRVGPAERGIAAMLTSVYRNYDGPLTEALLFEWHREVMQGRSDLAQVGGYRRHDEPMQVVSGPVYELKVHFEAPPSAVVPREMAAFLDWFAATGAGGGSPLPALTRAGLAHLYFETLHPFEDGNGRVGRAIAEMALAQGAGQPALSALSLVLQRHRSAYYNALEAASRSLEVDEWLDWFADRVLEAQRSALASIEFIIHKTRLLDRLRGRLNARQEKALLRLMRDGPGAFVGGLSAGKYTALTGASAATATRDLAELVEWGALVRTGEKKGTRYGLPFEPDRPRE